MAKKRLLYIEDLYDFYSNKYKRSTKFSAEKTGEPLVVQVLGRVNFDESDKNKDGLLPVHLQSCHTDLNINGSNIESSVMEAALPSFRYDSNRIFIINHITILESKFRMAVNVLTHRDDLRKDPV